MESLNLKKFQTLEKNEMKNVIGGFIQPTNTSIWTTSDSSDWVRWDTDAHEDAGKSHDA